jgi:hypothetical protein
VVARVVAKVVAVREAVAKAAAARVVEVRAAARAVVAEEVVPGKLRLCQRRW